MNQIEKKFDINDTAYKNTLYHFLAMLNNFIEKNDNIYKNKDGKKYILTKYGFKPVDEYNMQILNDELTKKINTLEEQIKLSSKKHKNLTNQNITLHAQIKKVKATNKLLASKKPSKCACGASLLFKMYDDYILAYCRYCSNDEETDNT